MSIAEDEAQPPWLSDDVIAPVIASYEARLREMRQAAATHAKAMMELRRECDALVAVRCPLSLLNVAVCVCSVSSYAPVEGRGSGFFLALNCRHEQ